MCASKYKTKACQFETRRRIERNHKITSSIQAVNGVKKKIVVKWNIYFKNCYKIFSHLLIFIGQGKTSNIGRYGHIQLMDK